MAKRGGLRRGANTSMGLRATKSGASLHSRDGRLHATDSHADLRDTMGRAMAVANDKAHSPQGSGSKSRGYDGSDELDLAAFVRRSSELATARRSARDGRGSGDGDVGASSGAAELPQLLTALAFDILHKIRHSLGPR